MISNPGNEKADQLANKGRRQVFQDTNRPIPISAAKQETFRWEEQAHRSTWRKKTTGRKPTCRQTKMFLPEPNPKVWAKLQKYGISNLRFLTQMITGHNCLRRHLWKMKYEDSPTCQKCLQGEESAEHYICHCPAYSMARQQNFGRMFLTAEDLKDIDYDVLLKYIRQTKRFENN